MSWFAKYLRGTPLDRTCSSLPSASDPNSVPACSSSVIAIQPEQFPDGPILLFSKPNAHDPSPEENEMSITEDYGSGVSGCDSTTPMNVSVPEPFSGPLSVSATDQLCFSTGSRVACAKSLLDAARRFARSNGFIVACNPHFFTNSHPHPVHGVGSKIWQRGRIYCTFKDGSNKSSQTVKTTCTWYIAFTFDRDKTDYFIKQSSLEHNHDLNVQLSTKPGELQEITLDANLEDGEREMIHSLARYALPLFKVYF